MGALGSVAGMAANPMLAGSAIAGSEGPKAAGKKSAPAPPDFMALADKTAVGNHPNQTNAFGSSSNWTQDPTSGQWNGTQSFGGPLAGLAGNLQGQAANAWSTPLDNGSQARQHAEDAIYGRAQSRLDPMWNQREQATNAGLANQGLDPSSEAGQATLGNFNRGRNDAYSTAMQDAIMGGGQEAQRQQGMDLQSRNAPLGALSGLMGFLQQPHAPGGADYMGAGAAQYGANQQQFDANGGALGGFGQLLQALGPLLQAGGKAAAAGGGG